MNLLAVADAPVLPLSPARALLADPEPGVAARLRAVLQGAFPAIAPQIARSASEVRQMFASQRPDLVILASSVADHELIGEMARAGPPRACVLVYATHIADERIFPALCAGASGYLLQHEEVRALAEATRAIVAGDRPLSPALARLFLRYFIAISPREALDADEYALLERIAAGGTLGGLSSRLGLAVRARVRRIYDKLARSAAPPVGEAGDAA
jgi:DNA-binding NarL/FixJ family response regulator